MTLGGERSSVQNPIIHYVQEIGWQYLSPDDALRLRGGEEGRILQEIFLDQIQRLNAGIMDGVLAQEIMKKLNNVRINLEGNEEVLQFLRGQKTVFVPDRRQEVNVSLIDFENLDRNVFHVSDEVIFYNKKKRIRPDIVFFINGIPIIIVETKAAHKYEGIAKAFDQIRRYHDEGAEFLTILQVFAFSHLIRFYYGPTWNTTRKALLNWRDDVAEELKEGEMKFERLVKSFFDRRRTLKIIKDYILFARQDDEIKKIVLRPHQMRAVEKCFQRAKDMDKNRGLIWHTQGSGKTYSMIILAKKLLDDPTLNNPTVLMLVDRNELQQQLFSNLASVGFGNVRPVESKRELKEQLRNDRRGIIISTIHKFEDMPQNINTRKNFFVLIDEAHRTTTGILGNNLMAALPNATIIGFTGTPIDKNMRKKGTHLTFGKYDAPLGYLDKYSITDSIQDGTTVPLNYMLAPNKLQVDKDALNEEFLDLADAEGVTDMEQLDIVLNRAVRLKNMLKNRERIDKIANFISDHFTKNVEPLNYKAFVVAVDREACCLYKQALDKYLPSEYSKVVISSGQSEGTIDMTPYFMNEVEEKRVRKDFRSPNKMPKILIVTQKLLTGFDAPILYCMYVDKPMRDHVLLQAIARVNRPYEDENGRKKTTGLIVDFVGVFNYLKKALAFDSQELDIEGVLEDIEKLKLQFEKDIQYAKKHYLPIISGKKRDKAVEAVLSFFRDEEKRKDFYEFYKSLNQKFDIIAPDAFLADFHEDFDILTRMYKIVKESYEPGIKIDKEFSRKTAELVQKHVKGKEVLSSSRIYEINANTIKKIEQSTESTIEKVFNLARSIYLEVEKLLDTAPYLIPIGERVQLIIDSFLKHQQNSEEALAELIKLVNEMNEATSEQEKKKLSKEAFTIYWILKKNEIENPEEKTLTVYRVMKQYKYWKSIRQHEIKVRRALYKVLRDYKDKMIDVVNQIMKLLKEG